MLETHRVTAEEILTMGEGRRELIAGEIVEMTAAGFRHSRIAGNILSAVARHARGRGLGEVAGADGGYRLARDPDTVRVPDVSFVAATRLEGVDTTGFLPFAPDLAVEVVSPSDPFGEVEARARMWLAHGTRLVWVVEPEQRLVFVYRPDGARLAIAEGASIPGEDVLPGLSLPVADCF